MKMILSVAFFVGCAILIWIKINDEPATASDIAKMEFTKNMSIEAATHVPVAEYEFFKACPEGEKHWPDIAAAEMSYFDGSAGYPADAYGWPGYFQIDLTVKESPKMLSAAASGHRLQFRFGRGDKPGVVTSKDASLEFCGWGKNPKPGSDYFRPYPFTLEDDE